jgi:hypothetical protein
MEPDWTEFMFGLPHGNLQLQKGNTIDLNNDTPMCWLDISRWDIISFNYQKMTRLSIVQLAWIRCTPHQQPSKLHLFWKAYSMAVFILVIGFSLSSRFQ